MRAFTNTGLPFRRRLALILVAAYLPSLVYIGHLDVRLRVPALGEVALPFLTSGAADGGGVHQEAAETHGDHCHGSTASCADAAAVAAAPVATLQEETLARPAEGLGVVALAAVWRPSAGWAPVPPSPPPRGIATT